LFVDIDCIMSDPYDRDIRTNRLSPSLASHAPKVNIIILIVGSIILVVLIINGIYNTKLNIIPSKQNKDINKWVRWSKNASSVI